MGLIGIYQNQAMRIEEKNRHSTNESWILGLNIGPMAIVMGKVMIRWYVIGFGIWAMDMSGDTCGDIYGDTMG